MTSDRSATDIQHALSGAASKSAVPAHSGEAEGAPTESGTGAASNTPPEHQGAYAEEPRDPRNDYDLTLTCRSTNDATGAWRVSGAILKHGLEPSYWMPGQVDLLFETDDTDLLLLYLEEKSGGNGYTYDSLFFWIRSPDDAPALIAHYDQILARDGMFGSLAMAAGKTKPPSLVAGLVVHVEPPSDTAQIYPQSVVEGDSSPRIYRVGLPSRMVDAGGSRAERSELGGQSEWHLATPWAFRALAAPNTFQPMLAAPEDGDPLEHRCAYWTSLLYLLLYRLGWADPAAGLDWWQRNGYPVEDETLKLIHAVWLRDGRLQLVRTWLHQQPRPFRSEFERRCRYKPRVGAIRPSFENIDEVSKLGPAQLHLEDGTGLNHLNTAFGDDARTGTLLRSDSKVRRAVLVTDSMIGWYGALIAHGSQLPDLHGRSWRVDVVAKPVGFLGTFRRSRVTDLWFTGRHSTHRAGT